MDKFPTTPPVYVQKIISDCIEKEEGGWVLTQDTNDPDGGWTYAGVTAKSFNAHMLKRNNSAFSYEDIERSLLVDVDILYVREIIKRIYYEEYFLPLLRAEVFQLVDPNIKLLSVSQEIEFQACVFSCAVNRGVANAIKAWDVARTSGVVSQYDVQANFVKAWQDQYTKLVAENAAAEDVYIQQLENIIDDAINAGKIPAEISYRKLAKPKSKRWKYLAGWINRTQRFM